MDKDKSLTTRARHTSNTRLHNHHPSPSPSGLFDQPDPRLLDSYILSRLHFEEFLRSQSDLFYQMMLEREKALSVKSDSVAVTPRGLAPDRDRASSSQSDVNPHYSTPWKTKSDKLCGIPAGNGYEVNGMGSGPSYSSHNTDGGSNKDNMSNSSSRENHPQNNKYFDKCMVRTSSLNELETLVDRCIMPEEVDGHREPTPPPPFIRVQRSPNYPVVPRGRTVSPEEDDQHQMLLGGVLSVPHANKYVEESRNGVNGVRASPAPCRQNGGTKGGKASILPWKRSSKSKNKAKSEKQALAAS